MVAQQDQSMKQPKCNAEDTDILVSSFVLPNPGHLAAQLVGAPHPSTIENHSNPYATNALPLERYQKTLVGWKLWIVPFR
jgi:hypothetical protein